MVLLVSNQCKHSIKFAIFQGIDKLVFKDRKEFNGSIFTQLTEVYKLIDLYNGKKASFHDLIRTDERDYPEDAIREALLNAIVHRDYSFSGSTLINIYLERLEISSLGGLVPGLSLEATRKDVENVMGIGTTHAINIIKEMINKDLIKKVGKGKKTRYIKN